MKQLYTDKVASRDSVKTSPVLCLSGVVFEENSLNFRKGEGMIYLGGVEVLATNRRNLKNDYKRVMREWHEGTLEAVNKEMSFLYDMRLMGNLPRIGDSAENSFEKRGYGILSSRRINVEGRYVPIVTVGNEVAEVDLGMVRTNPRDTGYVVAVSSGIMSTNKILDAMYDSLKDVPETVSCTFGVSRNVVDREDSWVLDFSLPTRTGVRKTANSLVRIASGFVDCLKSK